MDMIFVVGAFVATTTLVGQIGFPKEKRFIGASIGLSTAMGGLALFLVIGIPLVWWLWIHLVLIVGAANVTYHLSAIRDNTVYRHGLSCHRLSNLTLIEQCYSSAAKTSVLK